MHGHRHFEQGTDESGNPDFDRLVDRLAGYPHGRGGGRSRGRRDGSGLHGGYGSAFGGPMFGRGPKVGRGDVRAAIIALLAEEPMHGYQIITELTERSGGVWNPSPGSVYPTLQAMEDQGLVTADKAEGKRVFSLTDAGRAAAEAAGDAPAPWEEAARERRPLPGRLARPHGRRGHRHHAGGAGGLRPADQGGRRDPGRHQATDLSGPGRGQSGRRRRGAGTGATAGDGRLEKKRRAAAHPDRPGERCSAPAGAFAPVIDHAPSVRQ